MKDADIISMLRIESDEFRKIEEDHRQLDKDLDEMNKKKYLTPDEEVEKKRMQKQKLQYKDRMAQLIREHSKSNN
jgi:uncharacterized protein YdcH (DUF465 family)